MRKKLYETGLRLYTRLTVTRWKLSNYLKGQEGATAVEYALVIAVVVIGVVGAATVMFEPLEEFFEAVVDKIKEFIGG